MRRHWLAAATAAGAVALALAMLLLNVVFEIVGSVPAIPGCGFLAGDLTALLIAYPLLSALITARIVCVAARRPDAEDDSIVRCGTNVGLFASGLYFGLGLVGLLRDPQMGAIPDEALVFTLVYSVLIVFTARATAAMALRRQTSTASEG